MKMLTRKNKTSTNTGSDTQSEHQSLTPLSGCIASLLQFNFGSFSIRVDESQSNQWRKKRSLVKMEIKSFNLPHYFQSNRIVMAVLTLSVQPSVVVDFIYVLAFVFWLRPNKRNKMPYRIRINYDKFSFDSTLFSVFFWFE